MLQHGERLSSRPIPAKVTFLLTEIVDSMQH
jgi:hypothetical protein